MTIQLEKQNKKKRMLALSNGKRIISIHINEKSFTNLFEVIDAINVREKGLRYPSHTLSSLNSSFAEFPMEDSDRNSLPNLLFFLTNSYSLHAKQVVQECSLLLHSSSISKDLRRVVRVIRKACRVVVTDFVNVKIRGRWISRGDAVILTMCVVGEVWEV